MMRRSAQLIVRSTYVRYISSTTSKSPSKAQKLANAAVMTVVDSLQTEHRLKDNGCLELKQCNLCSKPNKEKVDNIWKLNVRPDGSYYCFRCGIGGSFVDLKRKANKSLEKGSSEQEVEPTPPKDIVSEFSASDGGDVPVKKVYPNQLHSLQYHLNLFPANLDSNKDDANRTAAKHYLNTVRGLSDDVLQRYLVGYTVQQFLNNDSDWIDHVCVTFPIVELAEQIDMKQIQFAATTAAAKKPLVLQEQALLFQRNKYRAIDSKAHMRLLPKGGSWGFFGWHTIYRMSSASKAVIITEGEYDCMAVAQALQAIPESAEGARKRLRDTPVISLPIGANAFPSELIPLLDRFTQIYVYMDYDQAGQTAAEKIVRKLGPGRCYIVTPPLDLPNPPKDANDALRAHGGEMIVNFLLKAKQLSHQHIETFGSLRSSIMQYINSLHSDENGEGTGTPSLPALSDIVKGFRRGELVVLSGPTGCGKTTLLSQLSLDFARQGALTLWGSFEVKNTRLLLKMLQQSYRGKHAIPLSQLPTDQLNHVLDDFEALPLQFMNFFGATNIDTILEAMEYTVDKDDTHHIIIDNLQFLMPRINAKNAFEKFEYQDIVIEKFRKFATEKNVNIILVVHPRKQDDDALLGLSSIGGSAKASQEADLVLLLQKSAGQMFLDVRKNRYDGAIGRIGMTFDVQHCVFDQTSVDTDAANFLSPAAAAMSNYGNYYSTTNNDIVAAKVKAKLKRDKEKRTAE